MEEQEILDRCGLDNWDEVARWLDGYTVDKTVAEFNKIWPLGEDNKELAEAIYRYLAQFHN